RGRQRRRATLPLRVAGRPRDIVPGGIAMTDLLGLLRPASRLGAAALLVGLAGVACAPGAPPAAAPTVVAVPTSPPAATATTAPPPTSAPAAPTSAPAAPTTPPAAAPP